MHQCVHVRMRVFSLSFSLTRYRKVRRDDVTSVAYERPVTRSFTNDDDEERYTTTRIDYEDDENDDEEDYDEEGDGVRDDTHRKTRISGVGA